MSQRAAFAGLLGGTLSALLLVPAVWFVIPAGLVSGGTTVPLLLAVFLGFAARPPRERLAAVLSGPGS